MCRHLGTLLTRSMNALPRPNSEFLATPSVVCKPRTRSKHPKVALFEPAPKGPWAKNAKFEY